MEHFIFSYLDNDNEGIFRDMTDPNIGGVYGIEFWPSHKINRNRIVETIKRLCLSYELNKRFKVPL